MNMSAVIIASGRATRLGDICKHKPKCLLPFDGVPFLRYVIFWLLNNGISDIVVTGSQVSQAELIEDEIRNNFPSSVRLVVEKYPKSTAQSSYVGVSQVKCRDTLLLTADNIWNLNLRHFIETHVERDAHCSVLVTTRKNVPNSGMVKIDSQSKKVMSLWDSENCVPGLRASTTGFYALRKEAFLRTVDLGLDLYVERESMQRLAPNIWGIVNNKFFYDFGTPENFKKLSDNPSVITKYFGEPTLN
ncbi:MAG: hypothetical protein A2808_02545 [Candidatus Moranbacteria bacterium RIFCSPHIGHO2_01_FULL_55_24]|nr:MAG: hypothetical protein A2808_02545 [Candidatus Moranbacteria bacterium RIFCSPHIGHO2_01_FULL_55_24]